MSRRGGAERLWIVASVARALLRTAVSPPDPKPVAATPPSTVHDPPPLASPADLSAPNVEADRHVTPEPQGTPEPDITPEPEPQITTESQITKEPDVTPEPSQPARVLSLRGKPVISALILLVGLLVVGFAQTHAGRHLTRSLGISSPGEPFTELYFPQPATVGRVPATARRGIALVNVSFVIGNRAHQTATYLWSIRVGRYSGSSGQATVTAGHTALIHRALEVVCPQSSAGGSLQSPTPMQVQVSLASPPESIGYRETCVG